jgi:pimeloyl-ACP methyl ester carboxylesterase
MRHANFRGLVRERIPRLGSICMKQYGTISSDAQNIRMTLPAILILSVLVAATISGGVWLWAPDKTRATLESQYLNARGDMIKVSGTWLHVRDSRVGNAPAVIMLHGFGSSLHTWEPWARALQSDYRVIRFDLPGSGLSEPDPTRDYSDARTLELLAALMDRLGLAQASLIGNSIGGRISWRFAAENPQRVTKLVLISPDGFASSGLAYGQKPSVPAPVKVMRYILPKLLVRMNLKAAYGNPAALTDDAVNRYYDLMLAPGVRDAMIARMEQTVLNDPVPLLRQIRAPVLLIWGERDSLIPVSNATDFLRNLPNATLVSFPGLRHVPQEESPASSLAPIQAFLAK